MRILAEICEEHIVIWGGKEEALGQRQSRVYSNEEQKRNWGVNWCECSLRVTPGLLTFSREFVGASSGGSGVIRSQPRLNCTTVTWHLPGNFQLDMDMLQRLEDIRRTDGAARGVLYTFSWKSSSGENINECWECGRENADVGVCQMEIVLQVKCWDMGDLVVWSVGHTHLLCSKALSWMLTIK